MMMKTGLKSEYGKMLLFLGFLFLPIPLGVDFIMRGFLTEGNHVLGAIPFFLFPLYLLAPFKSGKKSFKYILVGASSLNYAAFLTVWALYLAKWARPMAEGDVFFMILHAISCIWITFYQIWNIKRQWRA